MSRSIKWTFDGHPGNDALRPLPRYSKKVTEVTNAASSSQVTQVLSRLHPPQLSSPRVGSSAGPV